MRNQILCHKHLVQPGQNVRHVRAGLVGQVEVVSSYSMTPTRMKDKKEVEDQREWNTSYMVPNSEIG
ncbi:hypothetical protein SAY86_019498 [Trapa natans]|uniref:Uncharacterized protein n=1 Tax=Trapa natans TaxID=22666 RepID=A0AAN7R114_TRANT|nr:hypothetical protein SAY86_019498 [Trapa natans]